LPDGDSVLFTLASGNPGGAAGGYDTAQVVVQSIRGNDRTVVVEGGSAGRYLPTGHVVYAEDTTLFAIPFNLETRSVRGGRVAMLEDLRRSAIGFSDTANFDVSSNGTFVAISGDGGARIERTLTWVNRDGREDPIFSARPDEYSVVRISPDGTKVALVLGEPLGNSPPDIWILDQQTENLSLLVGDPAVDDGPVWSADGHRIFFRSGRTGSSGVYAIEVDTGETTLVAAYSPEFQTSLPWTISPDDRTLGLINATSDFNIAILSVADGQFAHLLNDERMHESEPSFAPNGAWIAYEEGREDKNTREINIRPLPDVARRRIPVGPGNSPVFSRDGSEIFFLSGDSLVAAPITYEPTISVGPPRELFETTGYFLIGPGRSWDVDPSSQRFLMIREAGTGAGGGARQIDIVINWFEELESRVPVD
jgi:serine/threonine-protein kinase